MKRLLWIICLVGTVTLASGPVPLGFWKAGPSAPTFPNDDFESYTNGVSLSGLNGGFFWNGAWVSRSPGIYSSDDFETYTDAVDVNGLNQGDGWVAAFVVRRSPTGIWANDNLESYSDAASVNGLNGGSYWGGAFVDR